MKKINLFGFIFIGVLVQAVFIVSIAAQSQLQNEIRIALVIGNADYKNIKKLYNSTDDATDVAAKLRSLGFEVTLGTNLNKSEMREKIRAFTEKLKEQNAVGLFYFAGHGVSIKGENYFLPIDIDSRSEDEVDDDAVKLTFLMDKLKIAKNPLNIIVLDACRNNPFSDTWTSSRDLIIERGLSKPPSFPGMFIFYSASPGSIADDGKPFNRNSPFTDAFLNYISIPNISLDEFATSVAKDVLSKTNNAQFPWKEGMNITNFSFVGKKLDAPITNSQASQALLNFTTFIPVPEKNVKRADQISQLGEELRKKEDCPLAIKNFTEAITLNPDSEYYYSRRGECYRMLGQFDKAIEDLDEAIRRNPQSDFAYASRGSAYWQKGQVDLVLRDLDEALRLNEKSAWAYLTRGGFHQQNGDCGKAVSDLTKAISLLPDNKYSQLEYGYINRSYAHVCQNNVEKAISDLNYVLKINPNSIEALDQRLSIYFQKKEFTNALADSLRLIKLNPKEAEKYYFLRSQIYWQQMSFSNAIEEFNQVISQNGEMVVIAYGMRGLANGINGNIFQAKEDVNKAIELSKTSEEKIFAYGFRSLYYLAEEEAKKSLADIELAFKINIDVKETEPLIKSYLFFIRATINSARKKYKLALADVNSAINLNPKMPEYYTLRADIYRQLGKFAEAMADERKSKELIQ